MLTSVHYVPGDGDNTTCHKYSILNPSFEETGVGWQEYGNSGFQYTTETASHGVQSIRVTDGGAYQVWSLPSGCVTIMADRFISRMEVLVEHAHNSSVRENIKLINVQITLNCDSYLKDQPYIW